MLEPENTIFSHNPPWVL